MSKRTLISVILAGLLCLFVTSSASAANIPLVTSPSDGGEKWLMNVYNNSGSALDEGDIVVWDIDASTGDDYMYVTTACYKFTSLCDNLYRTRSGITWLHEYRPIRY